MKSSAAEALLECLALGDGVIAKGRDAASIAETCRVGFGLLLGH